MTDHVHATTEEAGAKHARAAQGSAELSATAALGRVGPPRLGPRAALLGGRGVGALQRAVGNQAVQALLAPRSAVTGPPIQRTLRIGAERALVHEDVIRGHQAEIRRDTAEPLTQLGYEPKDLPWEWIFEQLTVLANDAGGHTYPATSRAIKDIMDSGGADAIIARNPPPVVAQGGSAPTTTGDGDKQSGSGGSPSSEISTRVAATVPSVTDAATLAGGDSTAAAVVNAISTLVSGEDQTEALRSMSMFLYGSLNAAALAQLVASGTTPQEREVLANAVAARLSELFEGRAILEPTDVQQVLSGSRSLPVILGEGLAVVKENWATLQNDGDRREYITSRISHESAKGYQRRVGRARPPIAKFQVPTDALMGWIYGNSAGSATFLIGKWGSGVTLAEEYLDACAKVKDGPVMVSNKSIDLAYIKGRFLDQLFGRVFNLFYAQGLPTTTVAFKAYVAACQPTLEMIYGAVGLESEAADLSARIVQMGKDAGVLD